MLDYDSPFSHHSHNAAITHNYSIIEFSLFSSLSLTLSLSLSLSRSPLQEYAFPVTDFFFLFYKTLCISIGFISSIMLIQNEPKGKKQTKKKKRKKERKKERRKERNNQIVNTITKYRILQKQ